MKMTIAQMRAREVRRLAEYHAENYTDADLREAERLMNSFYRLCGLAETNLYLANNERTCNSRYTAESEAREDRWYKRLSGEFKKFAGLELFYAGYAPSIGIIHRPSGACSEKISRFFYR